MITVPLPSWHDLFKAFLTNVDDDTLIKPWCENNDNAFWFSKSSWSLYIIAQLRIFFLKANKPNIWVPDLFCNEALVELRNLNVNLIFYPVEENLRPNISKCNILAKNFRPDIFILVHYFGFENHCNETVNFCKNNDAWLVEDATHILKPTGKIGTIGDFVIYSPHKHLPIPDGAILIVRRLGASNFNINHHLIETLDKLCLQLFKQQKIFSLDIFYWVMKRIFQIFRVPNIPILNKAKKVLDLNLANSRRPSMSNFSKNMLQNMIDEFHNITAIRESNRDFWKSIIYILAGDSVSFSNQNSPYLAAFSIKDPYKNEYIFSLFQKHSIPLLKWPDFPPEVLKYRMSHQVAIDINKNYFFLPVHQSIRKKEIVSFSKILIYDHCLKWHSRVLQYSEWEFYWKNCSATNLLQSWQYAYSNAIDKNFKSQCHLILNNNNEPIAISQVLIKSVPILGGVARLNRGPLLLNSYSEKEEIALKVKALATLTNELEKNNFKFFRYAPEMIDNKFAFESMSFLGFKKILIHSWESAKISLIEEEVDLLSNLKGKWRNQMRKGLKSGVSVNKYENSRKNLDFLINIYSKFKRDRRFTGPSENLIRLLYAQTGVNWKFNFFVAYESEIFKEETMLGILVSVISGDTAIYFLGLTNDRGRALQANSVLLWHAILDAKLNNCLWFDVGGLGRDTPEGIAEFKKGLNGQPYKLIGEWRKSSYLI